MDVRVAATIKIMRESMIAQLSVHSLSRRVNLSETRLRQLFKRETSRSPMQYLRDLRMQHAEYLLRSSFLTVKEVAFYSGAQDISHFTRDFKKQYGLTPTAYRTDKLNDHEALK